MTELTQKQKENRAYFARHAEEIRAQKREAYEKARADKPPKIKPTKRQKSHKSQKLQFSNPDKPAGKTATQEDEARREARRRIEDWHLARELEIESF